MWELVHPQFLPNLSHVFPEMCFDVTYSSLRATDTLFGYKGCKTQGGPIAYVFSCYFIIIVIMRKLSSGEGTKISTILLVDHPSSMVKG